LNGQPNTPTQCSTQPLPQHPSRHLLPHMAQLLRSASTIPPTIPMVYRVSTARPPHLLCNSDFGVDLTHGHEIKPQQSRLQQSCPQSLNSTHRAELTLSELTSRYQSRLHAIRADFTLSELFFRSQRSPTLRNAHCCCFGTATASSTHTNRQRHPAHPCLRFCPCSCSCPCSHPCSRPCPVDEAAVARS
jgi:hypothetical protein